MAALESPDNPTTLGSIPKTGWFNLVWSVAIALFMWALDYASPAHQSPYGLLMYLVYAICLGYWGWTMIGMVFLADARRVWQRNPNRRDRFLRAGVYGLVRRRTQFFCTLVCMPLACTFGYFTAQAMMSMFSPWLDTHTHIPFTVALVMGGSITLLTFTLDYMRVRLAAHEVRAEAAQRQAIETQLQLLRAQLDPHMMFNTLANLHALIDADAERAQDMLAHLITFLRATLAGSRSTLHALKDEFSRLQDYLALMQIRMGPRLQVTIDLPPELASFQIPPLLLQPLVENAIKHGLEPSRSGGEIKVLASQQGDDLFLRVFNTGRALSHEGSMASTDSGFGLHSVRERLQSTYGAQASLTLTSDAPVGGTHAVVRIPMNVTPTVLASALSRIRPTSDLGPRLH